MANNNKTVKAIDYAEGFVERPEFETYVDESFWLQDFSTEYCMQWMLDEAEEEGVRLTDLDAFNQVYDQFFYSVYQETEKGLS